MPGTTSNRRWNLNCQSLEDRTVPATAGNLEPSFGLGGRVTIGFDLGGTNLDQAQAVAVQPDQSVLIAGTVTTASGSTVAVVRLTPNGTLDTTFAGSGKATLNFGSSATADVSTAKALAIQPDGKILVAGSTSGNGSDFAVARLNANGTLDNTFGTNGKTILGFNLAGRNEDTLAGMILDAEGRIVLGGTVEARNGTDFGVVRLTATGTLDTTFGTGGLVTIAFDQGRTDNDEMQALTLTRDGRYLMVGSADTPNGFDMAFARVTESGALDPSFDSDGKRTFAIDLGGSNDDFATAIYAEENLQFTVAGQAVALGRSEFVVAKFNADASADRFFGANELGFVTINFAGGGANLGRAQAIIRQPGTTAISPPTLPGGTSIPAAQDRYVLVGTINPGTNSDMAFAGVTLSGRLDPSFGQEGKTRLAFNRGGRNNDVAIAAALQNQGKIIAVGTAEGPGNDLGDFAAIRLAGTPAGPTELLAGGIPNGTARVLVPNLSGSSPSTLAYSTGSTLNFFPGSTGNVRTATADINGDGIVDYLGGAGPGGGPRLVIFDGKTQARLVDFFTYESTFTGGIYVTTGDLNGDGKADVIVTPDEGGGPVVAVYDGARLAAGLTGDAAQIHRFFGIEDPEFRGGARATAGDITSDGVPEVVVAAGFLGGPRVTIWDGLSVANQSPRSLKNFFAFEPELRNGAFVAAGDINGDGVADLTFGGGPGGAPRVRIFDGKQLNQATFDRLDQIPTAQLANFFAGSSESRGGVYLRMADRDADGRTELIVGSGISERPLISVYAANELLTILNPTPSFQFDPFFTSVPQGVFVG